MDFPPIVNLALCCQMEVKGEGSCCRMTHIVSWWNGSRKTSLNHRRSATDRAAYCRGGRHLRVWRQSCSSALMNRPDSATLILTEREIERPAECNYLESFRNRAIPSESFIIFLRLSKVTSSVKMFRSS